MRAASRARTDGRTEFSVRDLVSALGDDTRAASLMAAHVMREQIMRVGSGENPESDQPPKASPNT